MAVGAEGALDTARRFAAAINGHDVFAIAELMSEDHVFIDSLGNAMNGRAAMRAGWRGYFATFPDYRIDVRGIAADGDTVLLHGCAEGTLAGAADGHWTIPAAWRAVVADGKIRLWQVYADNKPVYDLLSRAERD